MRVGQWPCLLLRTSPRASGAIASIATKVPGLSEAIVTRRKIVEYLLAGNELDNVVLTIDLPEHRLRCGDVGTIVLLHGDRGYEVEFVALNGETLAVVSLGRSDVRPIRDGEIAHARPVAA